MSGLPQELWALVLEIGVASGWEYRDLCSLALVCRKFRRLSAGASLWNALCAKDWPINENLRNETGRTKKKSSSSTVVGVARRALEGDTEMQVTNSESIASAGSSGFRRNLLRVREGENYKIDWKSKYREL